jgi:exo-1,4-beta-D-glucosaminidase
MWALVLVCAQLAAAATLLKTCSMVSNASLHVGGDAISRPGFAADGWLNVTLPATVMAGLLENGLYPDPFFAENLLSIPTAQFDVPWWFRCEFSAPPQNISFLTFKGINYKANLWLDGNLVGDSTRFVGTFRYFDVPVPTGGSGTHVVALQVFRPHDLTLGPNASGDLDLAISFVDWAPYPPDSNMGVFSSLVLCFAF